MYRKYEIEKKLCTMYNGVYGVAWNTETGTRVKERQAFGAASFEIGVQHRTLYASSCIFIVYSHKLYGGRLR